MALTDLLVVLAVFVGFGLLIISKLKTKSPERYKVMMDWIKDTKNIKESFRRPQPMPYLPDNARIM